MENKLLDETNEVLKKKRRKVVKGGDFFGNTVRELGSSVEESLTVLVIFRCV